MSPIQTLSYLFFVLDVVVFFGFLFTLSKALKFRPHFTYFNWPSKKTLTLRDTVLKERWEAIAGKINLRSAESMKVAVIEADKMADDILKRLGLKGQHMADRLSQMDQDDYRTPKRLWNAHRFRNNLVHSPDFAFAPEKIQKVIEDYRAFFKEVGIL